jgi:hypothetical protein
VGKNYKKGWWVNLSWVLERGQETPYFSPTPVKKLDLGNWLFICTLPSQIEVKKAELGKIEFGERKKARVKRWKN